MTRLRTVLLSLCACGLLGACEKPAQAPAGPTSLAARAKAMLASLAHKREPATPAAAAKAPQWTPQLPDIDASQVPQVLQQAENTLQLGQIERGNSPGPGALELFMAVQRVDPDNERARQGIDHCIDALFERGRIAMHAGKLADADRVAGIALAVSPQHRDFSAYQAILDQAHRADALVAQTLAALANPKPSAGDLKGAAQMLRDAQKAFPEYEPALAARRQWSNKYLQRAWLAAKADDYPSADTLMLQAAQFEPESAEARVVGLRIVELRQARTAVVDAQASAAVQALELDRADALLALLTRIAAQPDGPQRLRERIFIARHYGAFKPGQVFAEKLAAGGQAPEMVVIPFGRFTMGSADSEPSRQPTEGPQRDISFDRGFALGRNEVTVAEFRRFVAATGYATVATRKNSSTVFDEKGGSMADHAGVDWRRDFIGRVAPEERPVVHIAFEDAQAFAQWLSKQTGQRYRLPSEAEWEYAERAGSKSIYPWGDSAPRRLVGNLTGDGDKSIVGRSWGTPIAGYTDYFWGPAPVRSFAAEPWGTFDMVGNVSEWVVDCWHDSYQRAPVDGSAWVNPGCVQRVARGASWASSLDQARSAARQAVDADGSNPWLGFRVLREL